MQAIDRRTLLFTGGASIAASALPAIAKSAGSIAGMIVDTQEGPVQGVARDNSVAYYAIPFAAPPVGPLRFRAPRPALKRSALLGAGGFGPAPVQNQPAPGLYGEGPMPMAEDCLTLNIWSPRTPGPHPVYVWVHGGGNVAGSSRMPVFDGDRLARHGIVCVTITYRVGAWGFLDLGELLGNDYRGSGNNGLLDIIQSLRWVRDNITQFGGDPAQVTLGGQSAGAKNVCTLMAMPAARGLFHRAIVESGGAETALTAARAAEMAEQFVTAAGVARPADLLALDSAALLATQNRFARAWPRKYPFRAVIDGTDLPDLPLAMMRDGRAAPMPLLIGTTREEIAFFGPNARQDGSVVQGDLANMAVEDFAAVYRHYDALLPGRTPIDRRYLALTAEEYWLPTIRVADATAACGQSTWLYRLDMPRGEPPNKGYAVHGSELPLVWDKVRDPQSAFLGPEGQDAEGLAALMFRHWVSFIRSGGPDREAPVWPRYRTDRRATMLFDTKSRAVLDPDAAQRRLWDNARFDFS